MLEILREVRQNKPLLLSSAAFNVSEFGRHLLGRLNELPLQAYYEQFKIHEK